MTTDLPAWAEMTELDQGAALLHVHERDTEGVPYAVEYHPAKYFENPALLALSRDAACDHAAGVVREFKDSDGWCNSLEMRLFELALAARNAPRTVEAWNGQFGAGTPVRCWPSVAYGQAWSGHTSSAAFLTPTGVAAVQVRAYRFPVPLAKLEFRPEGRGEPHDHTTDLVDLDTWEMIRNEIDEADNPEEATRAALRQIALRGWLAHITPEAVEAPKNDGAED